MEPVTTAAAVTAFAKSPIGQKVIGGIKSTVSALTKSVHRENLFIDNRNKTFAALRANGFPESEWGAYTKNISHGAVPNIVNGGTYEDAYGQYYRAMFDDVRSYLNFKKPGMGDFFYSENQRIAQELPPGERFKGSAWNAVNSAADKFKNQNAMFETGNLLDGISIGQAYVENGVVKVPMAQQGEGIFSSLGNYAAAVMTPTIQNTGINGGQILSQVAGGVSGQQQIASSGQVVLTGGVQVGGSVTKNTTSNGSSSSSGGSMVLIIIAAVVAAFFLLGKKLIGR
jgi:hypothetical protein